MSYENKEKKNDEASNSLSMSSLSSHQRAGQKRTCLDENDKPKLPTSIQIKKPIHPHRRHLSYSSLHNLSAYQEEQSQSSGEIFVENTDQNSQDSDFMQDDGSDSNSVEESSIEEEEDELWIGTIIARKVDTLANWDKRCITMNTSEVSNGSLWLFSNSYAGDRTTIVEERYLVKWKELSFIHLSWETEDNLLERTYNGKAQLAAFNKKCDESGYRYDEVERRNGEFFDPDFVKIERILDVSEDEEVNKQFIIFDRNDSRYKDGTGQQLLVKWVGLTHTEATYEYERDLILMEIEYESHLAAFRNRTKKPDTETIRKNVLKYERVSHHVRRLFKRGYNNQMKNEGMESYARELDNEVFKNGGKLRDYQADGVSWLIANYVAQRSCILADEMGLGKTVQIAAFLNTLFTKFGNRGPFLILVPLSLIQQWNRELSDWTNLNVVSYVGNAADRAMIREYDFVYPQDRPRRIPKNRYYLRQCHKSIKHPREKIWMAQVILTTPKVFLSSDINELKSIDFDTLIFDEAHNGLKSGVSKLSISMRDENFRFQHSILLTGTPIQNDMSELWQLLNFIAPSSFCDHDNFLSLYGDMKEKKEVEHLHDVIRPYILRRLKGDVEKDLPLKEETIVEVELTTLQKKYYRAIFENNRKFMMKNSGATFTANLFMELRKCCNHPFLLKGVEEHVNGMQPITDELEFLVKTSGKMVLLDKLLPKLKNGGHRVLIFSQFKIMLNIIEDYLHLSGVNYERIDGGIKGKNRFDAVERFQNDDSILVFLLTTTAGGVGLNLTAADTCIIFDSDFNPQNDLQAQARCHRIGQKKNVQVYRFLTTKTIEMKYFEFGSRKLGLDKVVLQGVEGQDETLISAKETELLLRHGAYHLLSQPEDELDSESKRFMEEDIDTILLRRSKKKVHNEAQSSSTSFQKATFISGNDDKNEFHYDCDVDLEDPDFWSKVFGKKDVYELNEVDPRELEREQSGAVLEEEDVLQTEEGFCTNKNVRTTIEKDPKASPTKKFKGKEMTDEKNPRSSKTTMEEVDLQENKFSSKHKMEISKKRKVGRPRKKIEYEDDRKKKQKLVGRKEKSGDKQDLRNASLSQHPVETNKKRKVGRPRKIVLDRNARNDEQRVGSPKNKAKSEKYKKMKTSTMSAVKKRGRPRKDTSSVNKDFVARRSPRLKQTTSSISLQHNSRIEIPASKQTSRQVSTCDPTNQATTTITTATKTAAKKKRSQLEHVRVQKMIQHLQPQVQAADARSQQANITQGQVQQVQAVAQAQKLMAGLVAGSGGTRGTMTPTTASTEATNAYRYKEDDIAQQQNENDADLPNDRKKKIRGRDKHTQVSKSKGKRRSLTHGTSMLLQIAQEVDNKSVQKSSKNDDKRRRSSESRLDTNGISTKSILESMFS